MRIAFLHTKLQKLANWKIQADKLVWDSPFTTVLGHLELCCCFNLDYPKLRVNVVSVLEKLFWKKPIASEYSQLYARCGKVNANVLSGLEI